MIIVLKVLGIIVLGALAAIAVLILCVMARTVWLEEKKFKQIADAVDDMIRQIKEEEHEQSNTHGEIDQRPGCEMEPGAGPEGGSQVHTGGGQAI